MAEAALEMFALNGYADASMSLIAEAAGVSKAVLYDCFPEGKREIYLSVMEEQVRRFEAMIAVNGARAVLEEALSFALREPYRARVLFDEPASADAKVPAIAEAARRHIVETIGWSMKLPESRIETLARLLSSIALSGASGHTEAAVVMLGAAVALLGQPSTEEPTIAAVRRAYRPRARTLLRVVRGSASG